MREASRPGGKVARPPGKRTASATLPALMGAYDIIDLRPSWGALSLLAGALIFVFLSFVALAARFVLGFHFWSVVLWLVLPTLSFAGCVFGAIGLLRARRTSQTTARLRSPAALAGLILNGTVLLSCFAALVLGR